MIHRDTLSNGNYQPVTIFSIGHSNQSIQAFIELLRQHNIQILIDVRSSPYSKYVPHFNSTTLASVVEQAGIKYLFMAKDLGGRPEEDEFYDNNDHVLYNRVAESPLFLRGIQRLKEIGCVSRAAIMCSEEDPGVCHRHLLIGYVLAQQGVDLVHIRGNGRLQSEKQMASHEKKAPFGQSLWGEEISNQEENTWKSIRPVSRRKQPPSSSAL